MHPAILTVDEVMKPSTRPHPSCRNSVIASSGGPSRQLTFGPLDSGPRWSPEGKNLAFLRAPEPNDQKEGKPQPAQVYLLSMDGGEAGALTDIPKAPPDWPGRRTARLRFPPLHFLKCGSRKFQVGEDGYAEIRSTLEFDNESGAPPRAVAPRTWIGS